MVKRYKVIQWGLGAVGTAAARMMLQKQSIEIVGGIASRPEKIGRDIGELSGGKEIGVPISGNIAEALSKNADVVLHMTASSLLNKGNLKENAEEISLALKAKKNVITTSGFMYPWRSSPEISRQLDQLAKENGVTLLGTGAAPGFHTDYLPLALTGCLARVDKIIIRECEDDSEVTSAWMTQNMGFGLSLDEFEKTGMLQLLRDSLIAFYIEPIHFIADTMGWEVTEVRPTFESYTAKERLQIAVREIEPGTICAHKVALEGMKGENVLIYVEHIFKVCSDRVKEPEGENSIWIEGRPSVGVKLEGNWWPWALLVTAAHPVNAIPRVVEAPPGFVSLESLPAVTAIQ